MGIFGCIMVLLLLGLGLPTWIMAYPSTPFPPTECDVRDDYQTLCQLCAKKTKSKIVYPMCCNDEEEARSWCYEYITFGLQGQKQE